MGNCILSMILGPSQSEPAGVVMREPPGLTKAEANALVNRIAALENKMALIDRDSETFQDQLLAKMLAEKRDEAAGEMTQLHDIVINLQAAKKTSAEALAKLGEAKSEINTRCIQLIIGQPFAVTQLSFATFRSTPGATWLEITPVQGKPYQISEKNYMGSMCLVHPGDIVTLYASMAPRINSLWLSGPPAESAIGYLVPVPE